MQAIVGSPPEQVNETWFAPSQSQRPTSFVLQNLVEPDSAILRAECKLGRSSPNGIFRTKKGTPWDANLLVKRKLRPLCGKLRIAPRGLHAFRHGQGTLLDQMNVPVKVRQQRLGHASAELTLNIYTHAISSDERKFVEELGSKLIQ
jgi:integrase